MASPSSPSVRFTALDMARTTKTNSTSAPIFVMSSHFRSLTKDRVESATVSFSVPAEGSHSATTPMPAATTVWPSSFCRMLSPVLFFLRTLR